MTPLEAEIRRIIETDGPISVADYMRLCLGHPQHGYYVTRDPLGARGDFITAPEVSQMFGELIGAWAATVWRQMGSPKTLHLVELGPGRGALKRPGLIIGIFAVGYAIARSFCELFREPDPQLGFLWGGLTMGMVLSVPLPLAGVGFIVYALRQPPRTAAPAPQAA